MDIEFRHARMPINLKEKDMNLAEKVKKQKEDNYKLFVEKYSTKIDEQLETIFLKKNRTHWNVGVYDDKRRGTLVGDIYYDEACNGGGFNNLLRYVKENGFRATASYWCGGSCTDADGFEIVI